MLHTVWFGSCLPSQRRHRRFIFTATKHRHIYSNNPPPQPISLRASCAPLQVGSVLMLEWGGGEGSVKATPVKVLSFSPHCLRLSVINTYISYLLHLLCQQPPLGLCLCVYLSAPTYTISVHTYGKVCVRERFCLCVQLMLHSLSTLLIIS